MTMNWDKAAALLSAARRVLVLTHVSPDGDAIGSMLGLASALRGLGKDVQTAVDEGVPPDLAFLPGSAEVHAALDSVQTDLVIAVDCGDESRMGSVGQAARRSGAPLINLDHHSPTRYSAMPTWLTRRRSPPPSVLDWLDRLRRAH